MRASRSFFGFRAVSLALAVALTGATLAPPALAQSKAELAKARSLYKQGLSLEAAGDWGGALAKFEAVGKVKLTPQVRFHIARCKENLGRLNEALGDYRLAEYEAGQAGAKELAEITQAREGLEARIPKLTISRGEGAENASIELDGVELGEAKIGQEVAVDPGPHRIVAKLPKGQFEESVTLGEGESKTVDLVPPDDLMPRTDTTVPDHGDKPPIGDTGPKLEKKGGSALPWIIGGVGVVGLAAGGYFFLKKQDAQSQLDDVCRGDVCPKSKQSLQDDGKQYATLTTVGLGVGVVGIGVATVMLLSSGGSDEPEKEQSKNSVRVDVASTPSYTGVNLVGRF